MAAALVVSLLLCTLQFHSAVLADIVIEAGTAPRPRGHAGGLLTVVLLALIRSQLVMDSPLEFFFDNFQRVMEGQILPLKTQS